MPTLLRLVLLITSIMTAFILVVNAADSGAKMSKKELKALTANAGTSADHEKIAAYYRAEADHLKAEERS